MRPTLIPLACAALATQLAAQSTAVFPSNHTNAEGYSDTSARFQNVPFSGGINRTLYMYESRDLQIPNGAMIQAVGFRQDGLKALPRFGSGTYRLQLAVQMGASTRTVETAQRTFAQNYESAPVTVYARKIFDLPVAAKPTDPRNARNVLVPLDKPYRYDASKNLVVEYQVFANNDGNKTFSYPLDYAQFVSTVRKIGAGCKSSTGDTPELTGLPTRTGGSWRMTASKCPINAPALLTIGTSKDKLFGTLPLPITFSGNCALHSSIELTIPLAADTRGNIRPSLPVPDTVDLDKQTLYTQFIISDPFQGIGFITTNSLETTFGTQPRVARISALRNASATTGQLDSSKFSGQIVSVFEYR